MKSTIQARDEQVALILEELEKDIESFKIAIQNKGKQLTDLGKILKPPKGEYQKLTKENKYLKEYILKSQLQQKQQQQKQKHILSPDQK